MIRRFKRFLGLEARENAPAGDNYWDWWRHTQGAMSAEAAQSISSVYACISAISETVGSLPLHLFRNDDQRSKARHLSLYRVLHSEPNPYQTSLEFREWMTAAYLMRGNAFALIERDGSGQVSALHPLNPSNVQLIKDAKGYRYRVNQEGKDEIFLPHEVFHLRHRAGGDPLMGVSPIETARGVIDLALAEHEHGIATFKNGAKLQGIISTPKRLTKEQRTALSESWSSQYGGARNSGKTPLLEDGMEYSPISMTLEDSEWIAARQFSVEEVARIFRVPPTMIGDLRHGNYSNSVELARQFVTISLRRHLVAWEQAINKQLLSSNQRGAFFVEHSVEGLLRGDSTNRAAFYKSGIEAGWLGVDEARELENLPIRGDKDGIQATQAKNSEIDRKTAEKQQQDGQGEAGG